MKFWIKKKIKKSTGLVVYTQCTMQLFWEKKNQFFITILMMMNSNLHDQAP